MKRIALLPVIILLLCACGGVRVNEELLKEKTDQYEICAAVPVVSGLGDEQFEKELNEKFSADMKSVADAFKTRVSDSDGAADEMKATVKSCRGRNTLSIICDIYEYNGGTHGILSRPCLTIDTEQNKVLSLEDLFIDEKWRDFLNKKLSDAVAADSERYSDLWEKPVVMEKQCFYIDGQKLVVYYPPYELSYYARGFVEFEFQLSELEGYIKREYVDAL